MKYLTLLAFIMISSTALSQEVAVKELYQEYLAKNALSQKSSAGETAEIDYKDMGDGVRCYYFSSSGEQVHRRAASQSEKERAISCVKI